MNYDDETLMAYADGELDEPRRAEISQAIERDPELARRVARHRALRGEVAGAYAGVTDQPVPERLLAAARGPAANSSARESRSRGNVVQFPTRSSRAPGAPWRAREWTAMAASLVLGGLIAWQFSMRGGGDIASQGGSLVARGDLAKALDSQLASNQPEDAAVRIGLSFKAKDGGYCRSFVSRTAAVAGLACRGNSGWRVTFTEAVDPNSGDFRQAATTLTPALLQVVQSRIAGEPLDSAGEQAARGGGWK